MAQNHPQDLLSTHLLLVADTGQARQELGIPLTAIATAKVREAVSFSTAVAELQTSERRVDLAIIDLDMAGSAAVTLTRKLRDPLGFGGRNIAILLIGGTIKSPIYLAAARLGIQGHLSRPFTGERLRQVVRAALLARPVEVAMRAVAATVRSEAKPVVAEATVEPVTVPEPVYTPVENKPFRHGLQSLMRTTKPLTTEEAFGFEVAPASPPPRAERTYKEKAGAGYGAFTAPGRRLSKVS
jgi:DNA-binding NarL/FixJ family response regulator